MDELSKPLKAFVVALLVAVGTCFLISCDRLLGGTLSGNIKYTYRTHYDPTTGKPEFQTMVPSGSGKEVILLQYNDSLIQKDKELREECSPKITTAYKRCWDEILKLLGMEHNIPNDCDEGKTITQNCINNRNNIALPYTVQKVITDANGVFVFPNKIPYGKYILFVTWGHNWWLVPIEINQPQTNVDLTEKNAFMLNLN
jgi:hypothetical protein